MEIVVSTGSEKEINDLEYKSIIESRSELIFIGKHILVHKLEEDENQREWFIEWLGEWIDEYYLCDEFSDLTKFKKLSQDFLNKFPELEIIFLIEKDGSVCRYYNLLYHFVTTFFVEINMDSDKDSFLR